MKYSQTDWLKIHNDNSEGTMVIDGINLGRNGAIKSLRTTTTYSMCQGLGCIRADEVSGIKGKNPQFHLEDDGTVSLVVDEDGVLTNNIRYPKCKFSNEKIIPFAKWFKDYQDVINFTHDDDEDKIYEMDFNCAEVNSKGYVRCVKVDITHKKVYGPFGRNTICGVSLGSSEILIFTYGLARKDICDDWWRDDETTHCYFNENLDMVYDDCGYYYNKGYNNDFFNKVKKPH